MAFNLGSVGTGIGGFMSGFDQGASNSLNIVNALNQLQQQRKQQQAQAMLFNALKAVPAAGFSGGITPSGGLPGGGPQPPMPGQSSAPVQPQQPTFSPGAQAYYPAIPQANQQQSSPSGSTTANAGAPASSPGDGGAGATSPISFQKFLPIEQKYESGGGQNIPNAQGSGATGVNQITGQTWRETAPKVGVDITRYPTAMSAPVAMQNVVAQQLFKERGTQPWTDFNPKLAKAIGVQPGTVPPPMQQQAQQTAQKAAQSVPQPMWGSMELQTLAQQIDKANPNADPVVKMMALQQANVLLNPAAKMQWQMYMEEHKEDFRQQLTIMNQNFRNQMMLQNQQAIATRAAQAQQAEADRAAARGTQGGQILQSGGKNFMVHPDSTVQEITLPGGGTDTHKMGTASTSAVSPEAQKFVAEGIANYQLPPLSGWAMKTSQGQETMAQVMQINPDYQATKFTGQQSGARAMGTRSANLSMATDVAEEQIPLVKATSDRIDRTEFPTINSMQLAIEKGTGNEDVVRFMEQINTLKYVYARALNPTGVARIQDLNRFDDIINQAWSKGQVDAALDQMKISLGAERRGVNRAMGGDTAAGQPTAVGPDGKVIHFDGKAWVDEAGKPVQ